MLNKMTEIDEYKKRLIRYRKSLILYSVLFTVSAIGCVLAGKIQPVNGVHGIQAILYACCVACCAESFKAFMYYRNSKKQLELHSHDNDQDKTASGKDTEGTR